MMNKPNPIDRETLRASLVRSSEAENLFEGLDVADIARKASAAYWSTPQTRKSFGSQWDPTISAADASASKHMRLLANGLLAQRVRRTSAAAMAFSLAVACVIVFLAGSTDLLWGKSAAQFVFVASAITSAALILRSMFSLRPSLEAEENLPKATWSGSALARLSGHGSAALVLFLTAIAVGGVALSERSRLRTDVRIAALNEDLSLLIDTLDSDLPLSDARLSLQRSATHMQLSPAVLERREGVEWGRADLSPLANLPFARNSVVVRYASSPTAPTDPVLETYQQTLRGEKLLAEYYVGEVSAVKGSRIVVKADGGSVDLMLGPGTDSPKPGTTILAAVAPDSRLATFVKELNRKASAPPSVTNGEQAQASCAQSSLSVPADACPK